jgi:D-alanyl-D-alanine carboxypeptidase (penicillin-binding protein 5/6)
MIILGVCTLFAILLMSVAGAFAVYAANGEGENGVADEVRERLPLQTDAAVLVEKSTGRVLYDRNMHRRMYPASMTKLLTALVVLDYLDPDDVIRIGPEIRYMPWGYATHVLQEGEYLSVRVLLKGVLIRSVNEAARVLALHTVQTRNGWFNLNYLDQAKPQFATMMNERARALGANSSTFTNPYGLHHSNHITTAYDLALIARAFMAVPLLAEIVAMPAFLGDGIGGLPPEGRNVRHFHWTNTNLMLQAGPYWHPFVTGMRTGYTTPAGECLAASAYHNGLGLITILFDSQSPGRWHDTRRMLDFGFNNFAFRTIAGGSEVSHHVELHNPHPEDEGRLRVFSRGEHTMLLSHEEYATLEREVVYDVLFVATAEDYDEDEAAALPDDGATRLRVPLGGINEGDIVGIVNYKINGAVIYTTMLFAAHAVAERTFDAEVEFWLYNFFGRVFSRAAVPYWFGVVGTLFGFFGFLTAIIISRRARSYSRWRPMRGGRF